MPTVLRIDGLRVVVYPNDHSPAHVHLVGRGCEAVLVLNCPDGPLTVRESMGFDRRFVLRLAERLQDDVGALCAAWRTIHDGRH